MSDSYFPASLFYGRLCFSFLGVQDNRSFPEFSFESYLSTSNLGLEGKKSSLFFYFILKKIFFEKIL